MNVELSVKAFSFAIDEYINKSYIRMREKKFAVVLQCTIILCPELL